MTGVVEVEVDCHAYAWHEVDADYPECGPDNLVRFAETYGVIVTYLPEHAWADWAWWYRVQGPSANVVEFLTLEYGCDAEQAVALVEGVSPS